MTWNFRILSICSVCDIYCLPVHPCSLGMPTSICPRTSAELFPFENRKKKIVQQCNMMEGKTSNFHGKHSLAEVNQHCFCKKDFSSFLSPSLKKILIKNVGLKNEQSHASVHVLVLNLLYSCCLCKGFHLNEKNG